MHQLLRIPHTATSSMRLGQSGPLNEMCQILYALVNYYICLYAVVGRLLYIRVSPFGIGFVLYYSLPLLSTPTEKRKAKGIA